MLTVSQVTAFDIAQRFVGIKETPGVASTPLVLAMLRLDASWPEGDEVAWCSGFCNFVCWLLRRPRSKSSAARSWLSIGRPVGLDEARAGDDIVVLERGAGGHVGFFAGREGDQILILGGNQGDQVSIAAFPITRLLGIRRLVV